MDLWDTLRETERLRAWLRPLEEQARVYEQLAALLRASEGHRIRTLELAAAADRSSEIARVLDSFNATRALLEAATRSLPDMSKYFLPSADVSAWLLHFDRVNTALRDADFLAEVHIPEDEPSSEPSGSAVSKDVERYLVSVVSAETLDALQKVEFAPLVLLDRAVRNPELLRAISARDFEGLVAQLVKELGFEDVVLTPPSGDGGRDVMATARVHGIPIVCAFECKRYAKNRPVGPETMRALLGTTMAKETRAAKGILVTTSSFTPAARKFILTEPALDGKDFDGIVHWLREYAVRQRGGVI